MESKEQILERWRVNETSLNDGIEELFDLIAELRNKEKEIIKDLDTALKAQAVRIKALEKALEDTEYGAYQAKIRELEAKIEVLEKEILDWQNS